MKIALLVTMLVAAVSPVSANPYRTYRDSDRTQWDEASHVDCGAVRAYVAQVGLVQARTLARAAGMTAGQEWRARRCLAKKD
jgi:hypothetical protein